MVVFEASGCQADIDLKKPSAWAYRISTSGECAGQPLVLEVAENTTRSLMADQVTYEAGWLRLVKGVFV